MSEDGKPLVVVDATAIKAWLWKPLLYAFGVVAIYASVISFIYFRAIRETKEWRIKDAELSKQVIAAKADADAARKSRAPITVQIQTNMAVLAVAHSNLVVALGDYSNARDSVSAIELYKRRHSIHGDNK